ncbi:MAG: cytochrome P450 [Pseudomonadota bacterium]
MARLKARLEGMNAEPRPQFPPAAAYRDTLYRPPAPWPVSPTRALWRAISTFERDLITLLPSEAYRGPLDAKLGVSRRSIFLINNPETVQRMMGPDRALFPKNDLMVGALSPLVGEGLFVSEGAVWERQRRMIDPAFAHMRVNRAFAHMAAAMDDGIARLDRAAAAATPLSLEAEMSGLTADMIFRTIFSETLDGSDAARVFDAFARFQRAVANVELRHLLLSPAWTEVRQPRPAREAAAEIRRTVGAMLDARRAAAARGQRGDDIAGDVIAARDPETGEGFSREEMLDQLGVFFLAGHETTASALTWALFILSQQPETVARIRAEIAATLDGGGEAPLTAGGVKRLAFTRAVFREALRLYPPVTFLARVAAEDVTIGDLAMPRGAMVLISPWTIQRHEALWPAADRFDPDRFLGNREGEVPAGAYLPFGGGPRLCIGVAFAMLEATLILAAILRRYDIEVERPDRVRPVARLTTRPARDIMVRLRRL